MRLAAALACLALVPLLATSCLGPDVERTLVVEGRLRDTGLGCTVLVTSDRVFELAGWEPAAPRPPVGARATLRVREIKDAYSLCMVGTMVRVLSVIDVELDFRTDPVVASERWTPGSGPIRLGQVEVLPGARLTIAPGTVLEIIPEGALRVRGVLEMIGTEADSIRVAGVVDPLFGAMPAGPVIIDAAVERAELAHVVLRQLFADGPASLGHLRVERLTVGGASIELSDSRAAWLDLRGGTLRLARVVNTSTSAVRGDVTATASRLARLSLSYAQATVRDCVFEGELASLLFHGAAGGTFERNRFLADETRITVRHTSTPVFDHNDFVSPAMQVACESYELVTCVAMSHNWWGTGDEERIRAKIAAGCPVCYTPWLDGPVR